MMKRTFALLPAALLLAGLLAACGGKGDAPQVTVADYSAQPTGAGTYEYPEGWEAFAELDQNNTAAVKGLYFLRDIMGDTVSVSDMDIVTVNELEGEIASVTVNGEQSIPVQLVERSGKRVLYAEPGASSEDPGTIDLTTEAGGLPTAAPVDSQADRPVNRPVGSTQPAATTTRKPATSPPLQTAPRIQTTKPPSATQDPAIAQRKAIENSNMTEEEKRAALNLLSYKLDKNGIFYVEHEPWQKQFGFNQIYDLASPLIQLVYGTVRIKFTYGYVYKLYPKDHELKGQVMYDKNGDPVYETDALGKPVQKDWMIQMWKGRYGMVMMGAEIGVYTKPHTQTAEHYNAAVEEEELIMAMDVYQHNFKTGQTKYLFTRGPESAWWLTGFVPGSFFEYNKKSEVIAVINVQFPNTEMLDLFAGGMDRAGFQRGAPSRDNPETYTTSGTSIKLSWQYIDQDA